MDKLQKTPEYIGTENSLTVECEVLTNRGQTAENISGHIDTDPTDGTL